MSEEGVLTEGEHVINVTVRLKTANLGEINQTIKNVETFLNGKKEIHASHPFADDFNNEINDLRKLVSNTQSALNGGASQEVVDNMNKILSEKFDLVKIHFEDMFRDFVAERANAADEIKEVLKVKRDVSNLNQDDVTKLEKLLKDVAETSRDMYNVNYGEIDLLVDKINVARTKLNELKAFDSKLSALGDEQAEKLKLIKEWGSIKLGTIKGISSNLETDELRNMKAQISELSKDLNVSSNDSLDVIKMKLSNKKALSELIVKNNKLVDELISKGSSVKVDDKSEKKDESSVKVDDKSDKKDNSLVTDNSNVVDKPNKPKDNEVHEGNKVDEKVKEDRPDNSVNNDSSKDSSESHKEKEVTKDSEGKKVDNEDSKVSESKKDNEVTKPSEDKKVSESTKGNKVGHDSKVNDEAKSTEGNKVGHDSKVNDEAKSAEGNKTSEDSKVSEDSKSTDVNKVGHGSKVGEDSKSTEGNKVGHGSKVGEDSKSTEGNKVGHDSKSTEGNKVSLNDIIRSKTPVIEEIQELDLDIKYTKRMISDDINIQKIKDFNNKIPSQFSNEDSNINFIKSFLSSLFKK